MGSSSKMDELKKLIAGNHTETRAWRQEDTVAATTLATTVDSVATKVQDLVAKLELSPPPPPDSGGEHRRQFLGAAASQPDRATRA
jgi:hypothetical protein